MAAFRRMESKHSANWAELQHDLLTLIAQRVGLLEDFSAFRRVCRSWRSVAAKENFKGSQGIPWLMLAEGDYRCFVSAAEGNLIGKLMLPEAKEKRCFESLGWLITLCESGDMNLLHPISQVQIPLPHISTFKNCPVGVIVSNLTFIQKAVLSSCPCVSSKDNNYGLMVIHGGFLGFWKPGEKTWTTIKTSPGAFMDMTYCNCKFYAVNSEGKIFVCDVGGPHPPVAHALGRIPHGNLRCRRLYIAESKGEVLVVVRDGYDQLAYVSKNDCRSKYKFEVFTVDVSNGECVELQSLGDNALFVGYNASISFHAAKSQGIRLNCIYYTDDWPAYNRLKRGGGKDMGSYNMADRSVAPCYKGGSFSHICPPLWVRPFF